jgi:hypothetical protein
MPSSRMLRRVTLIGIDVSEELIASSEMSILIRATRRNIPEGDILQSHLRENLKSYFTALIISACILYHTKEPHMYSVASSEQRCDCRGLMAPCNVIQLHYSTSVLPGIVHGLRRV